MSDSASMAHDLADQALANLVNQFARPLDFLRELVQNSLDAGSPRVDVWLDYQPSSEPGADGILEIHVDDYGDGMDEAIIDQQLTKLFSSNKEDDLTKIGKFGIGFTSIFAIQPDAVLLRTGRHGQFWELLFHADRSFDKVRIEEPTVGTRITLYKRLPAGRVEEFSREVRWVLGYWCEHSSHPITFEDRTRSAADPVSTDTADPFGAFAAPTQAEPEQVNQPLGLTEAMLSVRVEEPDFLLEVGYEARPRYGFYNGGLTLVSATRPDVLGHFEHLQHLSFKVRSNTLEHTLTRDNVLQDEAWEMVMKRISEAAEVLRSKLYRRLEATLIGPEDSGPWQALVVREVQHAGPDSLPRTRKLFQCTEGQALSMAQVERQEDELGIVMLQTSDAQVGAAVKDHGMHMLRSSSEALALLRLVPRRRWLKLFSRSRICLPANARFAMPRFLEREHWSAAERRLIDSTLRLIDAAVPGLYTLALGEPGDPDKADDDELALEGPRDGVLFLRDRRRWISLPSWMSGPRTLLINRHHPMFRASVTASLQRPGVAAVAMAQALLTLVNLDDHEAWKRLLDAVGEAHGGEVA